MNGVAKELGRAMQATASLISVGIWSKVKCEPKNKPWEFDESA